MRKFLREPLLHFLLLGALLFALDSWLGSKTGTTGPRPQVFIGKDDIRWLRDTWTKQWLREPTEEEFRGVVKDYLKECLLAREAMRMGLEENDTIIRRRLAQKLEFMIQDTALITEPTEAALRDFHAAHRENYNTRTQLSLSQVFFAREAAAREALPQLGVAPTENLGDRSLLERDLTLCSEDALASQFGPDFAKAVFQLEPGSWHGPVVSSYGFHLVLVRERVGSRPLGFEEARAQVLTDWRRVRQDEVKAQLLTTLLAKYELVVDDSVKPLVTSLLK